LPDTFTTHYSLVKVEVGGSTDTWGGKLNSNSDALDAALFALTDAASLVSGTIPDARMPVGLKKLATVVTDLNAIADTGYYQHIATATGAPIATTGLVLHVAYDANNAMQFWMRADTSIAQYKRQKLAGTWGAWATDMAVQKSGDTMSGNLIVQNATPAVTFKGNGTVGSGKIAFTGPADEARASLSTPLNSQGDATLTVGTKGFTFATNGQFKAEAQVYAGTAYLNTDGNIGGGTSSIWANWGAADAYSAINARIEARAQAWANDRISQLQYRKVSLSYDGSSGGFANYAGAVVVGYVRDGGMNGQVAGLYFMYLQVYDPVRGWVGFQG
jgi:hypothetical protein